MNEKLRELLNRIDEKKAEIRNLVDAGRLEDARNAKTELKNLQEEFDLLKDLDDSEFANMQQKMAAGGAAQVNAVTDSTAEFANAARNGFRVTNSMNEGTSAEGGYTVPEDILTRIEKYRETKTSLIDLVSVENVRTNKGARTFKKRSQQSGFAKVGEGGKIGAKSTPQFERLSYEIEKYAGYFPVTNELLEDIDQNITGELIAWIGDESRVTRNNIIMSVIKTKEKVAVTNLDDIKKVLNVTLGQAFKPTSRIITNDDGLQWLDTLKDANGRDLLQPDPTAPASIRLRAGSTVVPMSILPNQDFPSDTETAGKRKIPMIIGDLKEGIKFWDRRQLSIVSSNIAVAGELNAFEEDLTLFRAIEREDCSIRDDQAFVYCELTIDDASVAAQAKDAKKV